MPFLGDNAIEASSTNNASDILILNGPYTAGDGGPVSAMSIYTTPNTTQNMRLVIYRDNGSGLPGALLAASSEVIVSASGWTNFTFPRSVYLERNDVYWIAQWWGPPGSGINRFYGNSDGSITERFKTSVTYSSSADPPDPLTGTSLTGSFQSSLYVAYSLNPADVWLKTLPSPNDVILDTPIPFALSVAVIQGTATVTAAVSLIKPITAAVSGTATVTATVVRDRALVVAAINGSATVTATLVRTRALTPAVNGVATVTATVVRVRAITPAVNGVAMVTASVVRVRAFTAAVSGVATVTATLVRVRLLTASVSGTATVTAVIVRTRARTAAAIGTATVTCDLTVIPSGGAVSLPVGGLLPSKAPRRRRHPMDDLAEQRREEEAALALVLSRF